MANSKRGDDLGAYKHLLPKRQGDAPARMPKEVVEWEKRQPTKGRADPEPDLPEEEEEQFKHEDAYTIGPNSRGKWVLTHVESNCSVTLADPKRRYKIYYFESKACIGGGDVAEFCRDVMAAAYTSKGDTREPKAKRQRLTGMMPADRAAKPEKISKASHRAAKEPEKPEREEKEPPRRLPPAAAWITQMVSLFVFFKGSSKKQVALGRFFLTV